MHARNPADDGTDHPVAEAAKGSMRGLGSCCRGEQMENDLGPYPPVMPSLPAAFWGRFRAIRCALVRYWAWQEIRKTKDVPALWHACRLLQLRVLCFGFFQDWDVGVGVFPEGEEIFVGGERPDAGGIGIRSL
jgi:hypothetical protein